MTSISSVMKKSLRTPDEVREVPNGRVEIVNLPGVDFARAVFEPGWRWSTSVKPIAGTDSCEFPHAGYIVQGQLHIQMDDGAEVDVSEGDVVVIRPGHDAWVVGDESCVMYDFGQEDADYAKPLAT
jgi:hypothetical protein